MRPVLLLLAVAAVAGSPPAHASGDEATLALRRPLQPAERAWYARTLHAVVAAIGDGCVVAEPGSGGGAHAEDLVPDVAEPTPHGAFPRLQLTASCASARVTLVAFPTEEPKLPLSAREVSRRRNAFVFRVFESASLAVSSGARDVAPPGDLAPIRSVVLTWVTPWVDDAVRFADRARGELISAALRARLTTAPEPACVRRRGVECVRASAR